MNNKQRMDNAMERVERESTYLLKLSHAIHENSGYMDSARLLRQARVYSDAMRSLHRSAKKV